MFGPITNALIKKTVKTVTTSVLEGVSTVLDKGAELADDAQEWVESLDEKDRTAREDRKEKRNK